MGSSDPPQDNNDNYGYTPSLAMGIIFLILYSVSTILHIIQMRGYRLFILMIIVCLIFAPSFYSAALYFLLGIVINVVAQDKSFLSYKMFGWLFVTADIFSLLLQSAGGGIAASADNGSSALDSGSNLMLAGIAFQLVVMIIFVVYGAWWVRRAAAEIRVVSRDISWLLGGMLLSSICIIIRGIYRTAELGQGWGGFLALNQFTFLLDAIPISIATLALNVWHPNRLLTRTLEERSGSRQSTLPMTTASTKKETVAGTV
ncbi:hypothetical protein RQP46_000230 [Phenoliferia psychrophenolica]